MGECVDDLRAAVEMGKDPSYGHQSGRGSRLARSELLLRAMAALKEAFNTVDTDRSGQIDRSELTVAIRAMDPHAPDHVIVDMIKFADADADGKVDFGEFKQWLCDDEAAIGAPQGQGPQDLRVLGAGPKPSEREWVVCFLSLLGC